MKQVLENQTPRTSKRQDLPERAAPTPVSATCHQERTIGLKLWNERPHLSRVLTIFSRTCGLKSRQRNIERLLHDGIWNVMKM